MSLSNDNQHHRVSGTSREQQNEMAKIYDTQSNNKWTCFSGSIVGFAMMSLSYIRPDLVVLFAVMNVTHFNARRLRMFISHGSVCTGAMLALLMCGYSDKNVYGVWFMSPIQWIKFNIFSQTSELLFGVAQNSWYVYKMLNSSVMFHVQLTIVMAGLLSVLSQLLYSKVAWGKYRQMLSMLLTVIVLFTVYSHKGHKEMRFLHNAIVCFHILTASHFDCFSYLPIH